MLEHVVGGGWEGG